MIKITCDSTADLDQEFQKRDIDFLPLFVTLGDKNYFDGVDITPPDIFEFVKKNKILPKTAARSEEDFYNFFNSYVEKGYEVIHFNISNKFSASFSEAQKAAERLKGVYVIDSLSLSSGTGLLALYAKDLVDEGKLDAETIYKRCLARIPYVQASFVVDTMEYLYKGGRCSGVASFMASVLHIKPMILVRDGAMVVGKKYMGNFDKIILKYVKDMLERFNTPDLTRIFITHTYADEKTVQKVKEEILKIAPFAEVIATHAGSTVTSHCGKNTLGILYINKPVENESSLEQESSSKQESALEQA